MRVAAVILLDIGVDSPVFGLLELLDDKGISVGVSLDVTKEPGWERFGDMVAVDARGGIQVLDKNGIVGSPCGTHDSALVNILDVSGLHGESIIDDGEVGHLSAILFESLGAFDGISVLIGVKAVLEIFDGGFAPSSDCFEIGTMFKLLHHESFRKSTIPSCLGCGQCLIDAFLNVVSLSAQGGNEGLVSILMVNGMTQLADSRASNVLGQGSNGFLGELVLLIVDEGEGALRVDDGGFGHLQDLG